MNVADLPLEALAEAPWNPNVMGDDLLAKLRASVVRFGVVENLVVRRLGAGYEVLNGNQRLRVYRTLGRATAPCVVVALDDPAAKLLAQTLNRLQGEDDLGLRAELIRDVLAAIPQAEVLALLPEAAAGLGAIAGLGQATIAEQLRAWQQAQAARLRHLTFQLTGAQVEVVEEALSRAMPAAKASGESPNRKGTALYVLAQRFLAESGAGGAE